MSLLLVAAALAAPEVTLTDAGRAPRAPLVLSAPFGQRQQARLRLSLTSRTKADGQLVPEESLPPVTLDLASEVVAVGPPLVHALTVTGVGVEGEAGPLADAIQTALAPLVGLEGTIRLAPYGEVLAQEWGQVEGVDASLVDELRRALDAIHPPLPSEPVGVGATWTTEQTHQEGFEVRHRATWTLAERSDDGLVLTAQLAQQAEVDQTLAAGVLPAEATGRLTRYVAVGEAKVVLRPGHLLPDELLEGMTTKSTLEVTEGDETTEMSTIAGHQLTITTRAPAGD